jgi:hypothetical protein
MSISLTQVKTEIHDLYAMLCQLVRRNMSGQQAKCHFASVPVDDAVFGPEDPVIVQVCMNRVAGETDLYNREENNR